MNDEVKICPKCTHSLIDYTRGDYYCPICEKDWNVYELEAIEAIKIKKMCTSFKTDIEDK